MTSASKPFRVTHVLSGKPLSTEQRLRRDILLDATKEFVMALEAATTDEDLAYIEEAIRIAPAEALIQSNPRNAALSDAAAYAQRASERLSKLQRK